MNRRQRMRLRVRRLLALLACCLLIASGVPFAAGSGPNRTVKAGVFFFDGYHMKDDDGTYSGYGIELLNLISRYSHLNFEFVGYDNTWEEMQSMLLSGEIDVVTSARRTRARTETFGFSDPIERNSTVLSVLETNTSIISGNYGTYDGMTVGVLAGSSQNRTLPIFAQENGFIYQTLEYDDSDELEAALRSGEIDAILTSNLRRSEGEKVLDTTNIDYFYAITRKDDQELLNEINYALSQMNLHEGDYWANALYDKYYGDGVSYTHNVGFTQRERNYIAAVASGEKRIRVTSLPGRKPYSFAEDGELKGIQPQFFDTLMQIAGLTYEMVVPVDNAEYERLKESGGVDVVLDWQQSSSTELEYASSGFLTNAYMSTGTALVTRKDFSGPVKSLAALEGMVGLPLEYERFKDVPIQTCSSQTELLEAVLSGKADAAFMRTHAAQYFVNNDRTSSLQFNLVDSEQIAFSMYVPSSSDHELVTILNKCIQLVSDDVISRLVVEYTAGTPENVAFRQYMAAHPEMILTLSALAALAVGVILFFYLRSRWNNKLLRTAEQAKRELEEQLAIVNALSRDYITVYKLDMNQDTIQALKLEGDTTSKWDWKQGETVPYTDTLLRYLAGRIPEGDKDDLSQMLSLERVRQKLSAGPEFSETFRLWLREEIHYFQFNCVAYRTEGQADPRVLIGFRNIDEIVRKEQKQKAVLEDALHMAQAANEAKTSFLSSMSHDIRTPMNAIIGFLALMKDEAGHPEMVREYVQRIDAASQHLLGLINDVLDMNKIESGSTTLSLAEMNLAEVIEEVNTIIRPQARAKNQKFDIAASSLSYEHLRGDKMRINQVLINLLSNSVKYTPENGTIQLRVEELPQVVDNYSRIRFTVSDNGLGMSEEYQKVLFEPFTREETKITHEIQGTGLGMAITKRLVDLMGGTIRVESRLGEGTTFIVELELCIQEQEDDPRFWAEHQIARMIVVDDDEDICQGIVRTMEKMEVPAEYATGGEQALRMIRSARKEGRPYDLILLDWKMPDMSGLETARRIREDCQTPILLMTAYDWGDVEQEAVQIGMSYFMPKPFFMSTFKEAVQKIIESRNKARRQEIGVVEGKHILVVDDIEVNRIILMKILGTLGATCDTAINGKEAVEKFMSSPPGGYDLILMDVQMPEMNGYEATRAIRSSGHPAAKTEPIIAMTANAFAEDVRNAIESGMDAHIAKPVQIDKLKATIQQVLDSRAENGGQ